MGLLYWFPFNGTHHHCGVCTNPVSYSATATYDAANIAYNSGGATVTLQMPEGLTKLTIACWVNPQSAGAWTDIFSFGTGSNRLEKSTTELYYWYVDASTPGIASSGSSIMTIPNAQWSHVCMTVDGSSVKFYLNGELAKTLTQTTNLSSVLTGTGAVIKVSGRFNNGQKHAGWIRDFRIYSHVISQEEINMLKQGLFIHYDLASIADGMIDVSGHRYNGTIASQVTSSDDSPVNKVSLVNASTTAVGLKLPDNIFTSGYTVGEFTLSCWYKCNAGGASYNKNIMALGQNAFIRFGPSGTTTYWWYGTIGTTNGQYSTFTIPFAINDGKWHLWSWTFNKGIIKGYIDDQLLGTVDKTSVGTVLRCNQTTTNCIGGYSYTSEIVSGSFSDARIYLTALSQAEIKDLFDARQKVDTAGNLMCHEIVVGRDNAGEPEIPQTSTIYTSPDATSFVVRRSDVDWSDGTCRLIIQNNNSTDTIVEYYVDDDMFSQSTYLFAYAWHYITLRPQNYQYYFRVANTDVKVIVEKTNNTTPINQNIGFRNNGAVFCGTLKEEDDDCQIIEI